MLKVFSTLTQIIMLQLLKQSSNPLKTLKNEKPERKLCMNVFSKPLRNFLFAVNKYA